MLYGDSVEVLSPNRQLVDIINQFVNSGDGARLATTLGYLDDNQLMQITNGTDPVAARDILALLAAEPETLKAVGQNSRFAALADRLDIVRGQANAQMSQLRTRADQLRVTSGAAELDLALAEGRIRYNDRLPLPQHEDTFARAFREEVAHYLQDPMTFVLLDSTTAILAHTMIAEGAVTPPLRSLANAGEALLGAGFLAKLPSFPAATMGQVLEVRRDLDGPLSRYRGKAAALRDHLRVQPFAADADAEVHHLWRTEVEPALIDLRESMADHSMAKLLLREVVNDLGKFVKGAVIPAVGLTVASATAGDVTTAVAVGLPAAVAGTTVAARAARGRGQHRARARKLDLYYLYETDRRIQRQLSGNHLTLQEDPRPSMLTGEG